MRPMLCKGGYPLPISAGMVSIVGYSAALNSTTTAGRLTLVDRDPYASLNQALPADSADTKGVILDKKAIASADGNISEMFPEPIKAVNGVAIMNADNLLPGKILVYVK